MEYHRRPPKKNNKTAKRILWIILLLEIVCAIELFLLLKITACAGEDNKEKNNWLVSKWCTNKKESMLIEMNGLSQDGIPTGCESVSTVMVLNYWGVNITPESFIDNYLPCQKFYRVDGTLYGPDPEEAFAGDPYSSNSLGCYPKVILKALGNMKNCHVPGMEHILFEDISGMELTDIIDTYIANNIPVLLWCTMSMNPVRDGMQYYLDDGSLYTWRAGEHCMVLCGYDTEQYYLMDPLAGGERVGYSKEIVEARYLEMGQHAVVVWK